MKNEKNIKDFIIGYKSGILFTEMNEDEESLDANYSVFDFDSKADEQIHKMAEKYISENESSIKASGMDYEQIGIDVWFTQSGQGAGFFDHNLDDDVEKKLSDGAKKFSYLSHEVFAQHGKVYIEGLKIDKMEKGSTVRANKSELLKYVNFEDNWHINLLRLIQSRNGNGLKYKNKNEYAVSRNDGKKGHEVFEFKTLEEAEKEFDKLIIKSKTYSKIIKEGKTANYGKGATIEGEKEWSGFVRYRTEKHISSKGQVIENHESKKYNVTAKDSYEARNIIQAKFLADKDYKNAMSHTTVRVEEKYAKGSTVEDNSEVKIEMYPLDLANGEVKIEIQPLDLTRSKGRIMADAKALESQLGAITKSVTRNNYTMTLFDDDRKDPSYNRGISGYIITFKEHEQNVKDALKLFFFKTVTKYAKGSTVKGGLVGKSDLSEFPFQVSKIGEKYFIVDKGTKTRNNEELVVEWVGDNGDKDEKRANMKLRALAFQLHSDNPKKYAHPDSYGITKFANGGGVKGGKVQIFKKGDKVLTRDGIVETILRKNKNGNYETEENDYTHDPKNLKFAKEKFDNGGGVGVSSDDLSDNEIGTGADMNLDQFKKGGNMPESFEYSIGGL